MTVVSNTSPINYLVLIGHAELLPRLFGRVSIPESVRDEPRHEGAPGAVSAWADALPDWVDEQAVPAHAFAPKLGRGERDAIALALRLGTQTVLLDDGKARRAAAACGLVAAGTLAILTTAAGRGLVDLPSAIDLLRATSFRAHPALLRSILERQ